ncbi:RxLR effector protein [Phytophthora megakarya]|uniref:RxLR effector protein n=1 Tax=Phytophthora megakarya TaxID=4795 RepID=A0A225X0T8_9STRA|nr:RxLR effector protein [Phytophthora megakarya]
MPYTSYVFLLAVTCVTSIVIVGGAAQQHNQNDKVALISGSVLNNEVQRLRRSSNRKKEERMIVPPVAAMVKLQNSHSITSAQASRIVGAVERNTPLPKWAKTLIVALSLGATAGIIGAGVTLYDVLMKSIAKKDST